MSGKRGDSVYKRYTYTREDGAEVTHEFFLYNALLDCEHNVRSKELYEGGGVECRKCKGWFCY